MAQVVVIGAGIMGLAAAYQAILEGHQVQVIEAGAEAGGMAAHFDFGGLSIERYYHFICTSDEPTFELLEELGLADKLRWRRTTMGQFTDGRLYPWGDPVALLRYPRLSLLSRMRYGLFALVATRRERWDALEHETARDWIVRWAGKDVYRQLWEPLFRLKFYEYADNISAEWIRTRIKRVGRSRESMFAEKLGYLEGGTETLVKALVSRIEAAGGQVHLSTPASRVIVENGRVTGVETPRGTIAAEHVISTVPTPLVAPMVPDLPDDWKRKYEVIHNIGVCCLVYKLRRPVTSHFWVNVTDTSIPVPGIIEFSNLRPVDDSIVFIPYYMPTTNEKFGWPDEKLLAEGFAAIRKINPDLTDDDLIDARVGRLRHAQPICEPGFASKIPPVQTPIEGLQIADTCFYYPEDRGVAESTRLGRRMARAIAVP